MMRAVGEARGVRAVYFNLCKLLHAHVTIVPFCGGARETLLSRGSEPSLRSRSRRAPTCEFTPNVSCCYR